MLQLAIDSRVPPQYHKCCNNSPYPLHIVLPEHIPATYVGTVELCLIQETTRRENPTARIGKTLLLLLPNDAVLARFLP